MLPAEKMKRPAGVTIIAVFNILGGIGLAVSEVLLSPQPPHGGLVGTLVVVVLLGIGIAVALLMLQNWARWVVIMFMDCH